MLEALGPRDLLTVYIWAALGWGGNAIIFCALGQHRFHGWQKAFFWTVIALITAGSTTLLYSWLPIEQFMPTTILVAMLLEVPPFLLIVQESWGKRIFYALNMICVTAIIWMINIHFFPQFTIVGGIAKIVMCILVALIYHRIFSENIEKITSNLDGHWLWLNGTGTLFVFLFYYFICIYVLGKISLGEVVAIMVANLVVYAGLFHTIHYMGLSISLSEGKLQEQLLVQQVQRLVDVEEQARIMRHDLRHHNLTIAAFVQKQQHQRLLDYLKDYDQTLTADTLVCYCDHAVVNNILGVYAQRANKEGVAFTVQARVEAHCAIAQQDLMSMLSNLLENALHSAQQKKQGRIHIELFERGDKLIVLCKNTATRPMCFQNGIPQSQSRQGSGMRSILHTVKQYDGLADFKQTQGEFVAHVILNME